MYRISKFDLVFLEKTPLSFCENLPQWYVLANHECSDCLHDVKKYRLIMLVYLWEKLIYYEPNINHNYKGDHFETEVEADVAFNNNDADQANQ